MGKTNNLAIAGKNLSLGSTGWLLGAHHILLNLGVEFAASSLDHGLWCHVDAIAEGWNNRTPIKQCYSGHFLYFT